MSKIPFKNYIYLFLVVVVSFALLYYLYLWFLEYDTNSEKKSVLLDTMQVINYNEIDSYLVENKDAYIYVSVTNISKVRQFDKKFRKLIINNNIKNKILFLDLTNEKDNSNIFGFKLPVLLVYKDGKLVDNFNVDKEDYNIHKMEDYLISIGVMIND